MSKILSSLAILTLTASAQDAAQLYTQTCSACHGPNGEGAAAGTFPPLAQSEWIKGAPSRAIQIVLHGIEGPIEVRGKDYNLAMPPHGGSLTDAQIATILTHVRTSFGNSESPITTQQVLNERKQTSKREGPYTANELLKLYPLPSPPSPIEHLISHAYEGDWNQLPDFDKLKATAVEEEQNNLISLHHHQNKSKFGIVWSGQLQVPESGKFTFNLNSDDGSRILIDNKEILKLDGTGPIKRNKNTTVQLTKGLHPIRVEYFEKTGDKGIIISWTGPGIKGKQFLTEPFKKKKGKPYPTIDLTPSNNEAVIYNNFIKGTSPRALGVGYPQGQNLAYSTQNCAPEIIWPGKFIDAGLHWTGRGIGQQTPMATVAAHLTKTPPYSLEKSPDQNPQFKGFILDKNRYPTFLFNIGDTTFSDQFTPSPTNLTRTIKIKSPTTQNLKIQLHPAQNPISENTITIQNQLSITTPTQPTSTPQGTYIQLPLTAGENTFTLTYSWN